MAQISEVRTVITERLATAHVTDKGKVKQQEKPSQPIGMFDSGVGGLTVLAQFADQLKTEDVVYVADTARVPYGGRASYEIININNEIIPFLMKQDVKLIIMACGTSSAIAYPVVKNKYKVPIFSLIDPGAQLAVNTTQNNKIGIIATAGTIDSKAYQNKIKEIKKAMPAGRQEVEVFGVAAPLFVPLVEGGFIDAEETKKVAKEYLKPLIEAGVDTIILGCTHYPHLRKVIQQIVGPQVKLVDPAEALVAEVKQFMGQHNLLKPKGKPAKYTFYATAAAQQFETLGSRLLGKPIAGVKPTKLS